MLSGKFTACISANYFTPFASPKTCTCGIFNASRLSRSAKGPNAALVGDKKLNLRRAHCRCTLQKCRAIDSFSDTSHLMTLAYFNLGMLIALHLQLQSAWSAVMTTRTLAIAGMLTVTGLCSNPVAADPMTYTFEPPIFALGQPTPLLNRAPNIGDAAFRTDFTTGTTPPASINNFIPNPLFSGLNLLTNAGTSTILTLTFNAVVSSIDFDFGVELFGATLRVASIAGNTDFVAGNVGGAFDGGVAHVDFANPVSTLSISVVGGGSGYALDNLVLERVPEPAILALLGLGFAGLAAIRRKRT